MNDFTKFVTLLATMSVAVERAVEVLKGFVPYLNKQLDPGTKENTRRAVLQIIAVAFGAITAYLAQSQFGADSVAGKILLLKNGSGYVIFGLLTAGGSAFWNHVLDIMGALKTQQENAANASTPNAAVAPAPAPAPAPVAIAAVAGKTP